MTNKEALEALLNGEKITTMRWIENSEITSGIKANEPKYIYFDFDKDMIVDENKSPVCFDTSNESIELEYLIHKEPLLTKSEKKFISGICKATDFPFVDMRFRVTKSHLLITVANRCSFAFDLNCLIFSFKGLERNKEYTWYELDVWGDD